jgi:Putative MetA-pathway of phenol degradation
MSPFKAMFRLFLATFVLLLADAASLPGAENPTNSEISFVSDRPTASLQGNSLLTHLLNWPEKEKPAEGEGSKDQKEEPLESDRPNFTDSPATVGRGRLQFEGGYQFIHGVAGDSTHDAHDLPELLVRYGVAERLELRIAWDPGFVFDRQADLASERIVTDSGGSDIELGFKYALTKQDEWQPESGIITSITAPVGARAQSSEQVDVLVNYLYSWKLNKKATLSGSTGGLWTAESGDHFTRFSQSASLDYELTEKLHAFNECYALFRIDFHDDRPQYYYDAGLTYLVTPNFQLDWRAGVGLNDASDRFFTGCGLSIRR